MISDLLFEAHAFPLSHSSNLSANEKPWLMVLLSTQSPAITLRYFRAQRSTPITLPSSPPHSPLHSTASPQMLSSSAFSSLLISLAFKPISDHNPPVFGLSVHVLQAIMLLSSHLETLVTEHFILDKYISLCSFFYFSPI